VNNVAPTATFTNNGPVNEGSNISLSLTNPYDPSSADTTAGFEYHFSCDDGTTWTAWSGTNTGSCATTDNGTVKVKGEIRDKDGDSTPYGADVTVNNVAPTLGTLTFAGTTGAACILGNAVTVGGISWTDPAGLVDAPFSVTINWGDSHSDIYPSINALSLAAKTHTYSAGGPYTISVTVTDKDGGTSAAVSSSSFSFLYNSSGILQPINMTGTRSSFKLGSTIPVKIRITDCESLAVTGLAITVHLQRTDSVADPVNEVLSSSAADTGSLMRFADGQYIYNLSTKLSPLNLGQDLLGTYHLWLTTTPMVFTQASAEASIDVRK
jgi:hypothetical protein